MFRSRDLRVYPYLNQEEYKVNNQKSSSTWVNRPADYTSDESKEVHPSIKSLTAADMIPTIQWPPRPVTANIDNSYEYRETSLKPPPTRYIAYDPRRWLPTDGCNQSPIVRGAQLRSRCPLTRRFTSKSHKRSLRRYSSQHGYFTRCNTPTKRSHKTIYEAQLWEAEWSPHTTMKQPIGNEQPPGNEQPTGNDYLRKWWNEAYFRRRTKPTQRGEWSPFTEQNNCTIEAHLRTRRCLLKERNNCTINVGHGGGDALPGWTKCAYKDQVPTNENHCTGQSALLLKYAYRYITRMQRHPRVKCAYEDAEPTKRRYEMKDMRWTACTWFESHHPEL